MCRRHSFSLSQNTMTVKELRQAAQMTQKGFADYFGISKRNIENWESETNRCPAYLEELMEYKLRHEGIISNAQ